MLSCGGLSTASQILIVQSSMLYRELFITLLKRYTNSLTAYSRCLLEKLTGHQLIKQFPASHGTRWFITALTRARHLSLSWGRLIQSMPPPHPTSQRSISILSSHLRLRLSGSLFPSGFHTKILYSPLLYTYMCYMPCPSQSSWFDHAYNIWCEVQIIKLLVKYSSPLPLSSPS
jgi:hypothetical protein